MCKHVSSFVFLSLFGIDNKYATHFAMGLLLAHLFQVLSTVYVSRNRYGRVCVFVCWYVYAYTCLQKHTEETTISPLILSYRAGSSLLASTSPHTTPFLTFLCTTRGDMSRLLSFQNEFQMNFCRILSLNCGWGGMDFSSQSWNLGESLKLTRPCFPFWVTGINNIHWDRAV